MKGYVSPKGVQAQPKLSQGPSNGVSMNPLQVGVGRAKNAVVGAVKGVAHGLAGFLNESGSLGDNTYAGMQKHKKYKKYNLSVKKTGSFKGKSNKLGHGGRAAQLKARGVPGGVIGELARASGAAKGQKNYHGKHKSQSVEVIARSEQNSKGKGFKGGKFAKTLKHKKHKTMKKTMCKKHQKVMCKSCQ